MNLIQKIPLLSLVLILLTSTISCTPSESAIQTSIAKTQAAMPTSTQIPLSEVNLDNILLVEGDLPEGFTTEPIGRYTDNSILGTISGQEQMVIQEFSKTNEGRGLVAVYLFEDTIKRNQAYDIANGEIESLGIAEISEMSAIGEKGLLLFKPVVGKITFSAIIFMRCHAFVYMARTMDDENSSVLKAYAKNLDERLTNLICY